MMTLNRIALTGSTIFRALSRRAGIACLVDAIVASISDKIGAALRDFSLLIDRKVKGLALRRLVLGTIKCC